MSISAATIQSTGAHDAAWHDGARPKYPPLFIGDWVRVLFIHYEVKAEVLQREVPFELDLLNGKAFVSLVAFTMQRLRLGFGGWLGEMAFKPISTTRFLNVRAYVRHRNERGIYFIAEFLSNRLCVPLGPLSLGLPYRAGRLDYRQERETGVMDGTVTGTRDRGRLAFHATLVPPVELQMCCSGTLDAFLLERYAAFTRRRRRRSLFRVWHQPWLQMQAAIDVQDDGLLATTGQWACGARLVEANFSPGVRDVWMGWPRGLRNQTRGGA